MLDEDGKDVVDAVVEVENWEWECWGGGEHVDAGGTTDGAWGGDEVCLAATLTELCRRTPRVTDRRRRRLRAGYGIVWTKTIGGDCGPGMALCGRKLSEETAGRVWHCVDEKDGDDGQCFWRGTNCSSPRRIEMAASRNDP